jgi:hypothetical protein
MFICNEVITYFVTCKEYYKSNSMCKYCVTYPSCLMVMFLYKFKPINANVTPAINCFTVLFLQSMNVIYYITYTLFYSFISIANEIFLQRDRHDIVKSDIS